MKDSQRYGGRNFIRIWLRDPRFRAVFLLRIGIELNKYSLLKRSFILRILKNRLNLKYGIDTGFNLRIGSGLKIVHLGGIVIHEKTLIGNQLTIMNNTTIGQSTSKPILPCIGNNVKIGVFSAILGEVIVEDNVIIGAHTLVIKSIKRNSTVVGIPARELNKPKD